MTSNTDFKEPLEVGEGPCLLDYAFPNWVLVSQIIEHICTASQCSGVVGVNKIIWALQKGTLLSEIFL